MSADGRHHLPPYRTDSATHARRRPHLFFFDFIPDARRSAIWRRRIGGTWGKATSALAMASNRLMTPSPVLAPYTSRIDGRAAHGGVCHEVLNDLSRTPPAFPPVSSVARLAYVVGNSKFYDHHCDGRVTRPDLRGIRFETESIERMRRRQSKSGLYEAVVFLVAVKPSSRRSTGQESELPSGTIPEVLGAFAGTGGRPSWRTTGCRDFPHRVAEVPEPRNAVGSDERVATARTRVPRAARRGRPVAE